MTKSSTKKIKAWIIEHSLTRGILEVEGEVRNSNGSEKLIYQSTLYSTSCAYEHEWCRTKEEAIEASEEMRKRQLYLLKKQIKLTEMYEIPIVNNLWR